ncbi:hypothetical protein C8R45DRAFT_1076853 [Mycena sanguinolenta]|nr:hypothetical protein C8R45DRAFT_1076853 [Mycena sanguinolenta]
MSAEKLRTRIVELDSEIERQKSLLEKLENDRILALRQLNAALDPVARLSLEISSEIFLQALAPSPSGKQNVPTALLRICNAWTDIALSTPRLWTTVRIQFPCSDDLAEVLPIWFCRARMHRLSISISLCGPSRNWNHRVSDVLWRHGGLFKHIEILDNDLDPDDDDLDPYHSDFADFAPGEESRAISLLRKTTSVSLPSLQTLAIRCQYGRRIYDALQICQLLCWAPNIVEFISEKVQTRNTLDPKDRPLIVPTLRRLIFGETVSSDDEILLFLTLPALEVLSLPMHYISVDELVDCVERSVAPLRDLALGWECDIVEPVHWQLRDCLRLIPTLTRFRMWRPSSDVITEFLAVLADNPSLLPNLHDLTIHILDRAHNPSDISDVSWRNLVRALSSRRVKQLYIVPVKVSPPIDVLVSLRELVPDGSKIHLGTEYLDFVAP